MILLQKAKKIEKQNNNLKEFMKNPQVIFLIVIVAVALVFGGYLLAPPSDSSTNNNAKGTQTDQPIADTSLLSNDSSPKIGKEDAKVKIVVFSDYQCPYCKTAHETIKGVIEKYSNDIRVEHRNFIVHPTSMMLAQAAEAANLQGKYTEMNDALFSKQVEPTEDAVINIAKDLKLDVDKFKSDLNSDKVKDRIAKDNSDAQSMNLGGTPSIFVNNQPVENFNNLESTVKELLGK